VVDFCSINSYNFFFLFSFSSDKKELARIAWKVLSDSYFTDVCLQFPPQTIAAGSLYFAAQCLRLNFHGVSWWDSLDTDIRLEEIKGPLPSLTIFLTFPDI